MQPKSFQPELWVHIIIRDVGPTEISSGAPVTFPAYVNCLVCAFVYFYIFLGNKLSFLVKSGRSLDDPVSVSLVSSSHFSYTTLTCLESLWCQLLSLPDVLSVSPEASAQGSLPVEASQGLILLSWLITHTALVVAPFFHSHPIYPAWKHHALWRKLALSLLHDAWPHHK